MNRYLFLCTIFFIFSCSKKSNPASLKNVVDGEVISNSELPEIVHIKMIERDGTNSSCTGTFLTDSALLTAAHCMEDAKYVQLADNPKKVTDQFFSHPSYASKGEEVNDSIIYDLAVVIFNMNTSQATGTLASQKPGVGADGVIVGFGEFNSKGDIDGKKRKGTVKISGYTGELAFVKSMIYSNNLNSSSNKNSKTRPSSLGGGDSGGPVLINGQVAGVASFVKEGEDPSDRESFHADINLEKNRQFIASKLNSNQLIDEEKIAEEISKLQGNGNDGSKPRVDQCSCGIKAFQDSSRVCAIKNADGSSYGSLEVLDFQDQGCEIVCQRSDLQKELKACNGSVTL